MTIPNRTQVIIRYSSWSGCTYKRADAIASIRIAGYTLLVHESLDHRGKFCTTHAPTGLHAGEHESIGDAISYLADRTESISAAIERALTTMAVEHIPMLSPEEGIQSFDWGYREQCRFDSGEYLPVPNVADKAWPKEHYLHLSTTKTESDFVAYTPSESYGLNDRQVRLKFGKYLKKTFSDMTDAEIQSAVVRLRSKLALAETPAILKFATDRETINDIFETEMYACDSNCTSCMHGKFNDQEIRPYHVYADSPDVAVAYVVKFGAITSRSVVSTKDKVYVRAYSTVENDSTECQVLRDMLAEQGYHSGDLCRNRLTKLPSDHGRPMLPYIDHGGMGVADAGKYWEVCEENEGDYNADCTDGTASRTRPRCERCDNDQDECECSECECCGEINAHGCEDCSFCHDCDSCTEHNNCQCERCDSCNEIISPNRRYTTHCGCDRCPTCGDLTSDGCDCESDEDTTETPVTTEVSA
jgi:hypothetical protein